MNHVALYTIATDHSIGLRRAADASRLGRQAPAVPSSPPARVRRVAGWIATLVRTQRSRAAGSGSTLPEQPIEA